MTGLLRPAQVRLVRSVWASDIVSPPYDLLSRKERRRLAEAQPRSFLNATRSPEDFPTLGPDEVIDLARSYLADRIAENAYGAPSERCFVYRITAGNHVQTGVVGDVPVHEFPGRIRPHESTRVDREDQLAAYLSEVGLTSSPVGLTYRGSSGVDQVVDRVVQAVPDLDLVADGEHQQVWVVPPDLAAPLMAAFDSVDATYIIDGHHRIAAARRLAEALGVDDSHRAGRLLAVAFPDHDLRVYPYDRWLGSEWPSAEKWRTGDPPEPVPGETIAVSEGGWLQVALNPLPGEQDTTALSRVVLRPRFGVTDERTDPRLVFIPGALGKVTLVSRVRRRGGVGFLLHPTSIDDLLDVSDRGGVMPPKSTFFAPKPRSGIFLADRRL